MSHKRITMLSIVLATVMLVSLFAVVSSATGVNGTVMAGTGPAVSGSNAGNNYVYSVDTSGTLWYTSVAPSGNGTWTPLGGVCTASPAAVSWSSSYLRIDVFVRGSDGAVWQKYYQNGWSSWHSLGGQLAAGTGPAVASWSAGRLDVFVQGTNGALWHKWWNGTSWSGWESLGGKLTASPAATWGVQETPANNIHVLVRGTDGAVWQKSYKNGWSSWHSLGGQVAPNTGPAVSQDGILVVQGTDHQLWSKGAFNGAGTAWASAGTLPAALSTSSPAAVLISPESNTLVSVSDTSGNIWWSEHNGYGLLNTWTSAGSPP